MGKRVTILEYRTAMTKSPAFSGPLLDDVKVAAVD
jgi:hypothetical protein